MIKQRTEILLFLGITCLLAIVASAKSGMVLYNPSALVAADSNTPSSDTIRPKKGRFGDRYGDEFSNPGSRSPLQLDKPSNVETTVELDSNMRTYTVREKVGDMDYRPPTTMTFKEFAEYQRKQQARQYWESKSDSGQNRKAENRPPPLWSIKKNGEPVVEIRPAGNVTLTFGGKYSRVANPNVPVRLQRIGGIDFDQQIALNLNGTIGDRLKITANWDTRAQFDFDNNIKISYTGKDRDIVREIQAGNVSMPLKNSLIRGAQNLFGIKVGLQFGRLSVTGIMSSQRGKSETITIRGGAQNKPFEVQASEYDANRHFFLSQYFRDKFDAAYRVNPANPNTGFKITRVEVYITNTTTTTKTLRNVVGLMDVGEQKPFSNLVLPGTLPQPQNEANNIFTVINQDTSYRNADRTVSVLQNQGFSAGTDFEKINGARKLEPERDYTFHPDLGFISLNSRLQNREALAVSFEYTYQGKNYKVGEMSEDYQAYTPDKVIVLKLIKPSIVNTKVPTWDLMMKNIYALGTSNIIRDGFQLRILYRDDISGIDNPSLQEGKNIKGVPLLQILGLDTLNPNNDFAPDGNFDFIENATVITRTGHVLFPRVEPFGNHLRKELYKRDPADAFSLSQKYVYDTLYSSTQNEARQVTNLNKFFLAGTFQSAATTDIVLPGVNISPGSVVITSGSITLAEGRDFTVDYSLGRVKILNTGIMASGKDINIRYERADLFSFRTKSLTGVRLEYQINPKFTTGFTLLHVNERPVLTRVNIGSEPIRNTQFGVDLNYADESRMITKLVDKLPVISTKEQSKVNINFEAAMIKPGTSKAIGQDGNAFIDDFEGTRTPYDFTRTPTKWVLGSTPRKFESDWKSDSLQYAYRRAKLSWYTIDNSFYRENSDNGLTIREDEANNHYVRAVTPQEIYPNRDPGAVVQNEPTLDLAYYPAERGAYNFNTSTTDIGPDGKFKDPRKNWAAITRDISFDNDFDNANIEFIEFWMMNPFDKLPNGTIPGKNSNTTGGELYFNLGDISEDVIKDGRHGFENGLPTNVVDTKWGKTTTQQFLTNAFDNGQSRSAQDVGFDGIPNEEERIKFDKFIQELSNIPGISPDAVNVAANDPSSDDFQYYTTGDGDERPLLERYKNFAGTENNSPLVQGNQTFTPASKQLPDNEDINDDKTINTNDNYYEYKLDLRPQGGSIDVRSSPYIVSKQNSNGVDWFQVRIPIRQGAAVGAINGLQTIKFFRMYMTGWEEPVVLRLAQFQLVSSQWRRYTGPLDTREAIIDPEKDDKFILGSVNIEENGAPTSKSPGYVVPPGFQRDFDQTTNVSRRLNEQSLQLCAEDLTDGDARAVFKNQVVDMVNYKNLKMFVHGHTTDPNTRDNDMNIFLRLGTDQNNNYYEVEVPVSFTSVTSSFDADIWRSENEIDIAVEALINLKNARNSAGFTKTEVFKLPYRKGFISVRGNPDLSAARVMMIGVRNPRNDGSVKSACFWFNELRTQGFNKDVGYATRGAIGTQLADLGTLNLTGKYSSFDYGDIDSRVSERARSSTLQYGAATNMAMDKFIPGKTGIKLPLYASYDKEIVTPKFNPLDPDARTKESINSNPDPVKRAELEEKIIYERTIKSINLTDVKKVKVNPESKSRIYDVENLSVSAGYTEETRGGLGNANPSQGNNMASYLSQTYTGSLGYSFTPKQKSITPFKNTKGLSSNYLKLIKEINISPVPSSFSVRGDLNRKYIRTQLYNDQLTTDGVRANFEKSFFFNRTYSMRWALTKSINANYQSTANSIIDEPLGDKNGDNINNLSRQQYKDSVWTNLKNLGRLKQFNQTVNLTYTLPLDKFPLTNFLNADVSYANTYTWTAAALGLQDTLGNSMGNLATNNRGIIANGKIDMLKLYNKSKFLKEINNPSPTKKKEKKAPPVPVNPADSTAKKEKPPLEFKGLKAVIRPLMTIRNINTRFSDTRGINLPGLLSTPTYFGLDDRNDFSPGTPFVFGDQNLGALKDQIQGNKWTTLSSAHNVPLTQTRKRQYEVRTALEPFKDFRVQVDAQKTLTSSYSEIFRYDDISGQYQSLNPTIGGSLNLTMISIKTAFKGDKSDNSSPTFETFESNRAVIKNRLDAQGRGEGQYGANTQDVLLPAFLSAYTGKDPNKIGLSNAPTIPLPNWKMDYAGLSKLPLFSKRFSSVNITHGYASTFDMTRFASSLQYPDLDPNTTPYSKYSPLKSNPSGEFVPTFVIEQVMMNERFAPLIGVNMRTKKNMSYKVDLNVSRALTLQLSNRQMAEIVNKDLVFGYAYTKSKFKIPFPVGGETKVLPNDITFKMDFTIRDTKTTQRTIDGTNVITAGNFNYQIRPNITYEINKRVNVQMFYERVLNKPKISSSFLNVNTAFGIRVRFSLV